MAPADHAGHLLYAWQTDARASTRRFHVPIRVPARVLGLIGFRV